MVSDQALCGGQCLKGATCSTVGGYELKIYVRTGQSWRNALSTTVCCDVFLSTDKETHTKFNALVLSVSGADNKHCHVPVWKQYCDMVVKWDGKKFTYKPLCLCHQACRGCPHAIAESRDRMSPSFPRDAVRSEIRSRFRDGD